MSTRKPDIPPLPEQSKFWAWFSLGALCVFGGLFLYVAVRHILYPGFTEPMEGDALHHIERAARGLPLYPAANGEFVPLTYLPFYYFAAVPFYLLFGDSLAGPRLLSTLCALLSGALVWRIAREESGERATAHLAAAFFFAGYRLMDAYLTCGLPDSFMLFWLLFGWYFLSYGKTPRHDVYWLIAFTLAFWTKQQGALFFGAALVYALWLRPVPGPGETRLPRWALGAGFLLGVPLSYLFFGSLLGERFVYHTLRVPSRWPRTCFGALERTGFVLLCFVPFATLLAGIYFKPLRRATLERLWLRLCHPVVYFTLTALLIAAYTQTAEASSNNHFIPFIAGLAVAAALGAGVLLRGEFPARGKPLLGVVCLLATAAASVAIGLFRDHDMPFFLPFAFLFVWLAYLRGARYEWTPFGHCLLLAGVLAAGQFIVSFYYPPDYLPDPNYEPAVAELRAELQRLDGPVIWADYGNVPQALTGRKLERGPSWVSFGDVLRQRAAPQVVERELSVFSNRLRGFGKLYLLTNAPLQAVPGWEAVAGDFELVRDYGEKFAGVPQIAIHWYSGRSYPKYLYRRRAPAARSSAKTGYASNFK